VGVVVKKCDVGHENADEHQYCSQCGLQFPADGVVRARPSPTVAAEEERLRAAALVGADILRERIERIVVLMQENRSFDHMLGYLSLPHTGFIKGQPNGRARSDVNGLKANMFNPGVHRERVSIRALKSSVFFNNPGHQVRRVSAQINRGEMNGFVLDFYDVLANSCGCARQYESAGNIMGYYTPGNVPVYDFFASHFTVCDRWFSAAPGPTWVNRMFLYAGTANNLQENGGHSRSHYKEYGPKMPVRLIVDALDDAGVDWHVYHGSLIPWMRLFPSFKEAPRRRKHVSPYRQFDNDCRRDKLPAVVFIDPNSNAFRSRPGGSNNDDQAPADVARGQEFVGEVYETLRRHGQLENTLFVVTYDEHGGFYDHVRPDPVPKCAQLLDPSYTTFGVRVPAFVISPYVEPQSMWSEMLTHPSITHSILLRFCPGQQMPTRVHTAPNLGPLLTRTSARELPSAEDAIKAARRARSFHRLEPLDPSERVAIDVLKDLASGF
jgi:phospholipase C